MTPFQGLLLELQKSLQLNLRLWREVEAFLCVLLQRQLVVIKAYKAIYL